MVEIQNVSRKYKLGGEYIHALDRVSLTIRDGEFVALMGPSGSGKTTLLNIIGGLDRPDTGEVVVDSEQIAKLKDKALSRYRNRRVGFVFQSFNLQPTLTALENVMLPLYFAKVSAGERRKRAAGLLNKLGLSDRAKHRPKELSGGQRQRVSVARALINEPSVILADEPTGNLDSKTGKEIVNLLKSLSRDRHVTVLMVTHDENMARIADRTIKILDGQIHPTLRP